jgi:hypothetical protein
VSHNTRTCSCDCTDFEEPIITDRGCCTPMSVRRTCEAPVVPAQQCPDEETEMVYDPETEQFTLIGQLMDQDCLPILDQLNRSILTPIN